MIYSNLFNPLVSTCDILLRTWASKTVNKICTIKFYFRVCKFSSPQVKVLQEDSVKARSVSFESGLSLRQVNQPLQLELIPVSVALSINLSSRTSIFVTCNFVSVKPEFMFNLYGCSHLYNKDPKIAPFVVHI